MRTKKQYKEFAEWITKEVTDEENWETNAVALGEVICRKLHKLGIIKLEGDSWVYEYDS